MKPIQSLIFSSNMVDMAAAAKHHGFAVLLFSDINILQSSAATRLGSGGIFDDHFRQKFTDE